MNSLIGKYAREVKHDGDLTGALFCNKDDAKAVAAEVTRTHAKHDRKSGNGAFGAGDDE